MRNPILILPVGIVLILIIALFSVFFGVMTMSEFVAKTKMFGLLLIPFVFLGTAFFLSQTKPRKDD